MKTLSICSQSGYGYKTNNLCNCTFAIPRNRNPKTFTCQSTGLKCYFLKVTDNQKVLNKYLVEGYLEKYVGRIVILERKNKELAVVKIEKDRWGIFFTVNGIEKNYFEDLENFKVFELGKKVYQTI